MKSLGLRSVSGLAGLGLLLALSAAAPSQDAEARVESCTIRAEITGRLATTTIEHVYANPRDWEVEVTFQFRLPPGGVVHDLAMWIDGARSPAVVYPRVTARRIYREIVERRRDPAILEYLGDGLWNLRVFPVPAKGTQKVQLVCTHVMPVRGGCVIYRTPEVLEAPALADKLDFSAQIRCPGGVKDLRAETHRMGVHPGPDGAVHVGFRADKQAMGRRIALSFVPGREPQRVVTWRGPDGGPRFWATLPPPSELFEGLVRKRSFVLVLDASSSMSGWRLEGLKRAAAAVLLGLDPADQFAVVTAASDVTLWKDTLVPAARQNVAAARAYVAGLRAGGGTDLAAAFRAAESFNTDPARAFYLLVASDGDDRVGAKGLADAAALKPKPQWPVHPAANVQMHWLLFGADEEHRAAPGPTRHGEALYVGHVGGCEQAADAFCRKAAEPAVGELRLGISGPKAMALRDVRRLPPKLDQQLVLTGRYARGGDALVSLSAEIDGHKTSWDFKLAVPDPPPAAQSTARMGHNVPRLQAHLACAELWSRLQLDPRLDDLERLVAISRQHHIVTRATAFLILENTEAYVQRGIQPPGADLRKGHDLARIDRGRAPWRAAAPDRARRIAALKGRAERLRAAGKYSAAADALDLVKQLDPTEYAACLAGSILREFVALREAAEQARRDRARPRRVRWSTWHEMLQPAGVVSRIPAPGLVVPAPKAGPLPKLPGTDPAVARKLQQKIAKIEFADIELKDVIQFLREVTELNLQVKWGALRAAGIDRSTAVGLRLANVTADRVLKVILEDLGGQTPLGYAVEDGVVTISTKEDLSRRTFLRIYDVGDMLIRVPNFRGPRIELGGAREGAAGEGGGGFFEGRAGLFAEGGADRGELRAAEARGGGPGRLGAVPPAPPRPGEAGSVPRPVPGRGAGRAPARQEAQGLFDEDEPGGERDAERLEDELKVRDELVHDVIALIREAIDPTSWRAAGGETGSIRQFNRRLIVRQTLENHRALCDLIAQLRGCTPLGSELAARAVDAEVSPEALFTTDARPAAWVLDLLGRVREKKLSKFSSVVVREVGQRTFARIGGIWFDCALAKASRIHLVEQGSRAARKLLQTAPHLEACFALGPSVVAALGPRLAVSLDAIGIAKPDDPTLQKLLAAAGK